MIRWGDPYLTEVLAAGYIGLLSTLWALLVLSLGRVGREWQLERPAPSTRARTGLPRVTVVVPARNEEACIGTCVRALLDSDYPDLEIVLVDDGSSDDTEAVARDAAGGDARFLLVRGADPPPGWAGKSWACMRGASEGTGELILFVDADVQVAPWALYAAVERLQTDQLRLLSFFGTWRLETFWEGVVIPVIGWFIRGATDLAAVNDPGRPEAFANGQFVLVRRDAYEKVGGHEAVRAEVLEDVRLARAFKAHALACGMLFAPGAFTVRLYDSLGAIVRGYGKNVYEGMDRRPLLALGAVLFIMVGTIAPYVILLVLLVTRLVLDWALAPWSWIAWTAVLCGLIAMFRWRLDRLDGRSGVHALTHVLGNLIFVYILLRSMFVVEVEWKGRRFVDGKAD